MTDRQRGFRTESPHHPQVRVTLHEGACVCTFRLWRMADIDEEACGTMLEALARDIGQAGGIIGHIKALAQPLEQGVRLSVTKQALEKVPVTRRGITLEGVAIVLAMEPDTLEQLVRRRLWALIPEEENIGGENYDYHW